MRLIFIHILFFALLMMACNTKHHRGYEGDLIPLKEEIARIDAYEKATERILFFLNKYGSMDSLTYDESDRLYNYQRDSLKLRFKCNIGFDANAEKGDTTIQFRAASGVDYYMRMNDDWSTYTLFMHNIVYTNKPLQTGEFTYKGETDRDMPYTVIKIKDKYYYRIDSYMEY